MFWGLAKDETLVGRNSLFIHMLLQQVLETERWPLFRLTPMIAELDTAGEKEIGVGE